MEICGKLFGLAVGRGQWTMLLRPAFCEVPGGFAQPLRACSACAGDYEDPDRTARMPDEGEDGFRAGEERKTKAKEESRTRPNSMMEIQNADGAESAANQRVSCKKKHEQQGRRRCDAEDETN